MITQCRSVQIEQRRGNIDPKKIFGVNGRSLIRCKAVPDVITKIRVRDIQLQQVVGDNTQCIGLNRHVIQAHSTGLNQVRPRLIQIDCGD